MLAACGGGGDVTAASCEGYAALDAAALQQRASLEYVDKSATPGQLCSATGMLGELEDGWPSHASDSLEGGYELTQEELSERMSGNLCRCSCYPGINAAIRQAAEKDGAA